MSARPSRELSAGINVVCSFMAPFPEDTIVTLRETGEFMKVVKKAGARVVLSYTAPFPGTKYHNQAKELGIRILTRAGRSTTPSILSSRPSTFRPPRLSRKSIG